jgi:hypothetical protein
VLLLCFLLQLGGSGVLVQPMTYIFDEEPMRWQRLLAELGIDEAAVSKGEAAVAATAAGAVASNGAK